MIRPIVIWPDNRLHLVSAPVPEFADVNVLVEDMFETMYDANGVGLSAIQIGVPLRVMVMDTGKQYVFINPTVTFLDGNKEKVNEGCLSIPGIFEQIFRLPSIRIEAYDRNWLRVEQVFHGFEAQCIQHEAEHFEGIVMADKVNEETKAAWRAQLRRGKQKKAWEK